MRILGAVFFSAGNSPQLNRFYLQTKQQRMTHVY